ncbi:MAG TPA: Hsp20/alpha crystallin family protein [Chthoniobacterales bacterium]
MNEIIKKEAPTPAQAQRVDYLVPPVNIHQDADGYILEVEMPGVPKSGVEVTFEDGKLTLTGHRTRRGEDGYTYRESSEADYRRVFDLDPSIDSGRIGASIEQGLLTVHLPKAEAAKPRKIAVL